MNNVTINSSASTWSVFAGGSDGDNVQNVRFLNIESNGPAFHSDNSYAPRSLYVMSH